VFDFVRFGRPPASSISSARRSRPRGAAAGCGRSGPFLVVLEENAMRDYSAV